MVTLICVIFFILSLIIAAKNRSGESFGICILISIVFGIWSVVLLFQVATGFTVDDKIAMYEEENSRIEQSIETTVQSYMEYEASTYENIKGTDAMSLIPMYPELKSDTLIQSQIEVYKKNNDIIRELKVEKIELSRKKFLLYFGR